jgi:hypothetical protein
MTKFRLIIPILLVLVTSSTAKGQDIVIIGDTPEKQAEAQQRWGLLNQGNRASNRSTSQLHPEIARYCRSEKNNRYSAYDTYSECVETEVKAKVLVEDPRFQKLVQQFARGYVHGCYHRSSGYNETAPNPWSYRYVCLKNALEAKARQRNYLDN